uniref:Uncharacterized protein n=1 Tax=Cajanus cajan TaxID=3821 RepID=A0A151RHY1_CAJCA|nr:hypothetical protein KK1_036452 [Cajanus cajan]
MELDDDFFLVRFDEWEDVQLAMASPRTLLFSCGPYDHHREQCNNFPSDQI